MKMFPMLRDYRNPRLPPDPCPSEVPWEFVAPHEQQAKHNHGQTLQRLSERGGLGADEMLAVVTGRYWRDVKHLSHEQATAELLILLEAWNKSHEKS